MEAIYIPRLLKAPEKTEEIPVQEFIAGLETLTPIRGKMIVNHGGSYLEVAASAETIVTLMCDRCLQQYNHRLSLDTSELIWLDKTSELTNSVPSVQESLEDLSESLPPHGYFQPEPWLYEQLSLAMPLRRLCNKNCQPPASASEQKPSVDSRWATLAVLKNQLPQ
ncbi:MAG: DUF177 domain-containing protein [Cyanophyceae cyanobacterium]